MHQLVSAHNGNWPQTWAVCSQHSNSVPLVGNRCVFVSSYGWLYGIKTRLVSPDCLQVFRGAIEEAELRGNMIYASAYLHFVGGRLGCLFKVALPLPIEKTAWCLGGGMATGSCQGQIQGRLWLKLVNIFILKPNAVQRRVVYLHLC